MIKAKLNLFDWFPQVHPNFSQIECDNLAQLQEKIGEKLKTMQLLNLESVDELSIDIHVDALALKPGSREWNNFLDFIRAQAHPVLKFNLVNLTQEHLSFNQELVEAYWSAVKKWHGLQIVNVPNSEIIQAKKQVVAPFVLETTFQRTSDVFQDVPQVDLPNRIESSKEFVIGLPKRTINRSLKAYLDEPYYSGYAEVLKACCFHQGNDTRILNTIEACVGQDGLLHMLQLLSKCPPEHLSFLLESFFLTEQAIVKYLPLLIRPEGKKLLEMVSKLPMALFPHWLAWMKAQKAIINPKTAIHKIDELYQLAQVYQVQIPLKLANDRGQFQHRIQLLKTLLHPSHPIWKGRKQFYSVQASQLFTLPIEVLQNLPQIFSESGCYWIRQEMIEEGLSPKRLQANVCCPDDIAGFYNYAAQFMQDNRENGFYQIESLVAENPKNPFEWHLAGWCASLPIQPSVNVFKALRSYSDQKDLIPVLYEMPLEKRPSSQDMMEILDMTQAHHLLFLKAYGFLFAHHVNAKSIWALLLLSKHHDWLLQRMDDILSQSNENSLIKGFELLVLPFAQNLQEHQDCCDVFKRLTIEQQQMALDIFSSYASPEDSLLIAENIKNVLVDVERGQSFKAAIEKLGVGPFKYFQNSLDAERVMLNLVDLFNEVKLNFGMLLDPKSTIAGSSISSYLKPEMVRELKDKIAELDSVLNFLKTLDIDKPEHIEQLNRFLTEFDEYFQRFFQIPLENVFEGKSMFIISFALPLKKNDSMQKLFTHLYDKFEDYKAFIGYFFSKDKLKIIADTDLDTDSLLQKYIEFNLKSKFEDEIESFARQKILLGSDEESRQAILTNLVNYIRHLSLNVEGIQSFFKRCEILNHTIGNAAKFEKKCLDNDLNPLKIWQLLTQNLENHQTDSYWKVSEELLDCLIQNKACFSENGIFSFESVFELLIKSVDVMPSTLDEHGCVDNPNWLLCLSQLNEFIHDPRIFKHPMFALLLQESVDYVLTKGKKYDFKQNVELYETIGRKNPELMQTLQVLLSNSTPENQTLLYAVLEKTRLCMKNSENPYCAQVITRILGAPGLTEHLSEINDMLAWLITHQQFEWFGLLASDQNWGYDEVYQLYQVFHAKNEIWSSAYDQKFPLKPKNWKIDPNAIHHVVTDESQVQDIPVKKPYNPSRWIAKRWNERRAFFLKRSEPVDATGASEADKRKAELLKKAEKYWTVFKTYPYPAVKQITNWLQTDIEQVEQQVNEFDTQLIEPTHYDEEDFNRWIGEVQFYNELWTSFEYELLKKRLQNICKKINDKGQCSRQSLKQDFMELKEALYKDPDNADLQDDFLATICSAYTKVVGKRLYPTQILTLLLNLKLARKNLVFEIDTGEGKGVTIALLALMKAAREKDNTVLVKTTTFDLVKQDLFDKKNAAFFDLFDVPSHIFSQNMNLNDFKKGGIYYTADVSRDYDVLMERFSLNGETLPFALDVIADEIDSDLFDQNTPIKLTEINPKLQSYTWVYSQINEFIDGMEEASDSEVTNALKDFLLHKNKSIPERVAQIQNLDDAQWHKWLIVAHFTKKLVEFKDFVVRKNIKDDEWEIVPVVNGDVKNGFDHTHPLFSGLKQFLYARQNALENRFTIPPETQVVSCIDKRHLKNVRSLVGFTGSLGDLTDVWEYQEALLANSVRVGRFQENRLERLSPMIAQNESDMIYQITNLALRLKQPLMILTDKIEDARRINSLLQQSQLKQKGKVIKLITGAEDDVERRQWFQGNEANFAKAEHAVTIGSRVCGRGIDMSPDVKNDPYILGIGIIGMRDAKQFCGRTARAGEGGVYQILVNVEEIERQWRSAFNFSRYPLNKDTLPTYINKIQGQLNFENRTRRLNLRLIDWGRKHVLEQLKELLSQDQGHLKSHYFLYYQHIQECFMELSGEILTKEKIIEESLNIWQQVMALLKVCGKESLEGSNTIHYEKKLIDALNYDEDNIHLLVNPERVEKTFFQPLNAVRLKSSSVNSVLTHLGDNFIPDELDPSNPVDEHTAMFLSEENALDGYDADELSQLKYTLTNYERGQGLKETVFMYLFAFIRPIFQWLNPAATLTANYLDHAWKTFKEDPSARNWKDFYRLLISAKKLYQRQKEQSIWHIDYWFDMFNQLRPWIEFDTHVDRELRHLHFAKTKINQVDNIYAEIRDELRGYNFEVSAYQPKGMIDRFMQSFQPLFKQDLDELMLHYESFMQNPDAIKLHDFYQQLQKVQNFHNESQEWRSWRLDYWWYWQSKMKPWMEVANTMPDILESKETPAFQAWKNKQKDISYFQLFYREYLVCQEQLRAQDRRYAFWFWGKENPLSELNSEYEKQTSPEMMRYELDEMARYFPREAMKTYNMFHHGTIGAQTEKQQTMYLRLLDLMNEMFTPTQNCKLSLDVSTHRMQMFNDELEKWRTRPVLMRELNDRHTYLR